MECILFCGNSVDIMKRQSFIELLDGKNPIIVTDPPFNIEYHYNLYDDNMGEDDYYGWLARCFADYPLAIIHYPEKLHRLSFEMKRFPNKIVSWVYNSNNPRQHRDIAFWGVKPIFSQVTQPYKNPNDKRVKKLIASGKMGARIYDWWYVNQVKNRSEQKTDHPCQMPIEVMDNIVKLLPQKDLIVIDPFMGSGTTGVACKKNGIDFIGIEVDPLYYEIAKERIEAWKNEDEGRDSR